MFAIFCSCFILDIKIGGFSECESEAYAECHEDEQSHGNGNEVFPLEGKNLVDTQTGESPALPEEEEEYEEHLCEEPYETGNHSHHLVEPVESGNDERSPASEEDGRGHSGADKEVEVFGKIVVAEVHTGIFGVVACGKFALRFGKVEGTTVTFGISCNEGFPRSDLPPSRFRPPK